MASGQRQTVNGVQTITLHGKNYVEVSERVHMVHEKKALFNIIKSEPMNVAERWLWVAVITVDGQQYIGNAEIKMNAPKGTPDSTNPFECGETSAIGRALAFAGFGSVESIASRDEIERSRPFNGNEQAAGEKPSHRQSQRETTNSKPDQTQIDKLAIDVLRRAAERYVSGGWNAVRLHLIQKYDLGDCADDALTIEHRQHAYELIEATAKASRQAATSGK